MNDYELISALCIERVMGRRSNYMNNSYRRATNIYIYMYIPGSIVNIGFALHLLTYAT